MPSVLAERAHGNNRMATLRAVLVRCAQSRACRPLPQEKVCGEKVLGGRAQSEATQPPALMVKGQGRAVEGKRNTLRRTSEDKVPGTCCSVDATGESP